MTRTDDPASAVAGAFADLTGRRPAVVASAPGRVNLIGDHTDYNDGLVLPMAIDRRTAVAVAARADGVVRAWSRQLGPGEPVALDDLPHGAPSEWPALVAGVVWALRDRGVACDGLDVAVDSTVPVGGGLASSAALGCAVAVAVDRLHGAALDPLDLARAAQRAEHEVLGAPVGLMDQAVAMLAAPGSALLLDCRSLATEHVPVPFDGAEKALLVVDQHLRHSNAAGGYAARRRECDDAARRLGVMSLRDATEAAVNALDEPLRRRARHVVTENARVVTAAAALRDGDVGALGRLFLESHASLREDFEVSLPALDAAVEAATAAGALGARLTGGGFGGSVIALVEPRCGQAVTAAVREAAPSDGAAAPDVFAVRPGSAAVVEVG